MSYPTCSGISCSADCADRDPRLRKDDVKSKSKDDVKSKSNDDSTKAQSGLLSICAADAPQFSSAVYNRGTQARKLQADATQSGRSMIEILGVLAIIGVLSVGGIAGYSKAMMQYKINKTVDQISQIVGNIRTLYANQKDYRSLYLNTALWKKAHLVPDEMWGTSTYPDNAFGGFVDITSSGRKSSDHKAFDIALSDLPEEACMAIATYDWGSGSSSGLIAVGVNVGTPGDMFNYYQGHSGSSSSGGALATPNGSVVSVPMPVNVAATACKEGDSNIINLKFY